MKWIQMISVTYRRDGLSNQVYVRAKSMVCCCLDVARTVS